MWTTVTGDSYTKRQKKIREVSNLTSYKRTMKGRYTETQINALTKLLEQVKDTDQFIISYKENENNTIRAKII